MFLALFIFATPNAVKPIPTTVNVPKALSGTTKEGVQVFVTWFEVTVPLLLFTKLASIVSALGELPVKVNDACPLLSVIAEPVAPISGPEIVN